MGCVPGKVLLEMGGEHFYQQHICFKAAKPAKCGHPGTFDFQAATDENDKIVSASKFISAIGSRPRTLPYFNDSSRSDNCGIAFFDSGLPGAISICVE